MEYSVKEFRKNTRNSSKICALHSAGKVAGKRNLELCSKQSPKPRVRMENGIPIHQETMYKAFLNKQDQGAGTEK